MTTGGSDIAFLKHKLEKALPHILFGDFLKEKKNRKQTNKSDLGSVGQAEEDQLCDPPTVAACPVLKWQYDKTNSRLCAGAQTPQVCVSVSACVCACVIISRVKADSQIYTTHLVLFPFWCCSANGFVCLKLQDISLHEPTHTANCGFSADHNQCTGRILKLCLYMTSFSKTSCNLNQELHALDYQCIKMY